MPSVVPPPSAVLGALGVLAVNAVDDALSEVKLRARINRKKAEAEDLQRIVQGEIEEEAKKAEEERRRQRRGE
jgi:CRISPR/Cas system-associated protein Cas5 (RAMP superfamily)